MSRTRASWSSPIRSGRSSSEVRTRRSPSPRPGRGPGSSSTRWSRSCWRPRKAGHPSATPVRSSRCNERAVREAAHVAAPTGRQAPARRGRRGRRPGGRCPRDRGGREPSATRCRRVRSADRGRRRRPRQGVADAPLTASEAPAPARGLAGGCADRSRAFGPRERAPEARLRHRTSSPGRTTPRSTVSCWPKSSRDCFRWTQAMTKKVPDDLDRTQAGGPPEGPAAMTTVKRKSKQLGQILIELGHITPEQLEHGARGAPATPKSLGRVLIDMGMIKEADLVRALAEQVGLEFVDLAEYPIDPTATTLLPEALARRYRALPIGERTASCSSRCPTPPNVYALDDIRTITGRDVQPVVATAQRRRARDPEVRTAWTARSRRSPSVAAEAIEGEDGAELGGGARGRPDRQARQRDHDPGGAATAPPTSTSSPAEHNVRIRFRVDGVLHEPMPPAPEEHPGRAHQPPQGHGRPRTSPRSASRRTAASR